MSIAAELEAEVKEYKLQLETVVTSLQADPENAELQSLKGELEEVISLTESSIAELKPTPVASPPNPSSPPREKWSKENHPAFQPGYRRPGASATQQHAEEKDEQPVVYKVNDTVMAKWKSGDKAFYPAKITSITGSAAKPVYIVTFKGYNNTETVFQHEIRPNHNQQAGQKRKADDLSSTMPSSNATPYQSVVSSSSGAAPPPPPPAPALGTSSVISAASTVDPVLANAARKTTDGGLRTTLEDGGKPAKVAKKISSNKALEGAKSKWQEFSAGGVKGKMGKKVKKSSMFKTGEGVNARVGFTGSGQGMRKDQARTRHIYDQGGEDEY